MSFPQFVRNTLMSTWLATTAMAAPDSVVTFNEVHFHPSEPAAPAAVGPEWIELHNQMSIRVDLSGWTIRGGVDFLFPEGTVVDPGAMIVVSQSAGHPAGALGPWNGRLDNDGEEIRLHERWGRMMDTLEFRDSSPWPAAADGAGPTLSKTSPDLLSDEPSHWVASAQDGGTPGAENFTAGAESSPRPVATAGSSWRYETTEPAPAWPNLTGFSDATWATGAAPLGTAAPATPPTPATTLPSGLPAYYFRKVFAYSGGLGGLRLLLTGTLKGEAVFHVNGVPRRHAIGAGPWAGTLEVPDLEPGANVLAIELRPRATAPEVVMDLALTLLDGQTAAGPALEPHQAGPIVINEIAYHSRPTYADPSAGVPYAENPAEWIELHNPGHVPVDLAGWKLRGGIDYDFPDGISIPPGGFHVVTNDQFSGALANDSDTIRLRDPAGQEIDAVTYFDSGRWPEAADAGGSTLELIDPAADNRCAENWAASDESGRSSWQTVSYRATGAEPPGSNNPSTWREFLFGFLDAGEALVDDVSVIEDPDGARVSLIQNGTFEGDAVGGGAAHWRLLGTHKLSRVEADPSGAGKVLRLVATSEFEHTYNAASTTLAGNRAISSAKTYEISFRARWLSGSPQLNSRLYLNRAARTTILGQPAHAGTPGAPNSRRVANAGPHVRSPPAQPARARSRPGGARERRFERSAGDSRDEPLVCRECRPVAVGAHG